MTRYLGFDRGRLRRADVATPLVFFHVPKTAGTTLSTILKAHFGPAMAEAKSQAGLDALGADIAGLAMVSGHFAKERVYPAFARASLLTLLRDPVERAVSQYANWHDPARIEWTSDAWEIDAASREAIAIAQRHDLAAFLASDNPVIVANTRNVFTRAFCEAHDVDPRDDDPALVDSAFDNLRSFFWLGLVERMEESMIVLARQLGLPDLIDGALQVHNPSMARAPVSAAARRLAREANGLDSKLYRLVEREFDSRLRAVLREGVRAALRGDAARASAAQPRELGFAALDFGSGWSFPEVTAQGQAYRWSYAGAEAEVLLPPLRAGALALDLRVLALGEGLTPDQVLVTLDHAEPLGVEALAAEQGWRLRCRFADAGPGAAQAVLAIAIKGGGRKGRFHDPRDNLGLALTGVDIRPGLHDGLDPLP